MFLPETQPPQPPPGAEKVSTLSSQRILAAALTVALPVAVLANIEVWMQSTYTRGVFHLSTFLEQYSSGIYQYRLLGRFLLLATYRLLLHHIPLKPWPMAADPDATLPFVAAYALLNGACFFLANALLLRLLWTRRTGFRSAELAFYFFYTLLNSAAMAVVTPYDQLAYLLILLTAFGVTLRPAVLSYGLVIIAAVAGTLNRETSFLATAMLLALWLCSHASVRSRMRGLAFSSAALSLLVYAGLRIFSPHHALIAGGETMGGKWGLPAGLLALLLVAGAVALAQGVLPGVRPALLFLAFSLPYLISILLTGILRELRLFIPLVLCLLLLYMVLSRQLPQGREADRRPY